VSGCGWSSTGLRRVLRDPRWLTEDKVESIVEHAAATATRDMTVEYDSEADRYIVTAHTKTIYDLLRHRFAKEPRFSVRFGSSHEAAQGDGR
jgi:hypothetical protein